jgi:small subunit ribosomal protein S3
MGQKVNPIGFRLGINRSWDSIWYAKKNDYSKFLIEDYKIRQCIRKNIINSGVSEIIIERSSKKCSVSIHTSRPGFVIGKKGSDIEKIKNKISKITDSEVYVNIKEIKKPELNAYLVAENIAQQLVKRIAYRRAMKRAMQSTMRLGAKGIKVCVSGRLAGNEIARSEWLRNGSIPLHTLRANLDYSESEALTTYGIIGVKVWIYKGEIFEKEIEKKYQKVKNVATNKK